MLHKCIFHMCNINNCGQCGLLSHSVSLGQKRHLDNHTGKCTDTLRWTFMLHDRWRSVHYFNRVFCLHKHTLLLLLFTEIIHCVQAPARHLMHTLQNIRLLMHINTTCFTACFRGNCTCLTSPVPATHYVITGRAANWLQNVLTWHADVSGFQVRHEVPLTRMNVDQVAEADLTGRPTSTLAVEVNNDVLRTADVEVVVDTAAETHPPVHRWRHHYYCTWPTGGVERLVQTIVTWRCRNKQPV